MVHYILVELRDFQCLQLTFTQANCIHDILYLWLVSGVSLKLKDAAGGQQRVLQTQTLSELDSSILQPTSSFFNYTIG